MNQQLTAIESTTPWAMMLGGMAMRPGDYELSRRRQPRPLVAAFVLALVEGVAVVSDLSGWWLTTVSAVPAIPAALFAYLGPAHAAASHCDGQGGVSSA